MQQSWDYQEASEGQAVYRLHFRMPDTEAETLGGLYVDGDNYDLLCDHNADVIKPDGTYLLRFRKSVLHENACRNAFEVLRKIHSTPTNRGMAAGKKEQADPNTGEVISYRGDAAQWKGGRRYINGKPLKKDGTLSNSTRMYDSTVADQSSAIIGSFDRYARFPFCRLSAFTADKPGDMLKCGRYFREIDSVFCAGMPDRYEEQMRRIAATESDWVVPGTAFTTITVNQNWRTACHRDAGDLKEGFGVLSVLEGGQYSGGFLVFPQYRVAVDMRNADVLLCDVHELHGNTPIVGKKGTYIRISVVCYYRAKMMRCGSAAEEEARVKERQAGDPLWDSDEAALSTPQVATVDGTEEDTDSLYDELYQANYGIIGGGGERQ